MAQFPQNAKSIIYKKYNLLYNAAWKNSQRWENYCEHHICDSYEVLLDLICSKTVEHFLGNFVQCTSFCNTVKLFLYVRHLILCISWEGQTII